jgi:phage protein D
MGPGVAISVDGTQDAELSAAASVEVYERMGEMTTYSLRYPIDIHDGDLPMLTDDRVSPGAGLAIVCESDGALACLVKGPVCGQQIRLVHGGAGSYCDVRGADSSVAMDREAKAAIWSDVSDSAAVSAIVAGYSYVPDVDSTTGAHAEAKHALVQRESDLRFVRRLARRNGLRFWVTGTPEGIETAHFKSPPIDAAAASDLTINLASPTVETLDIAWDVERPTSAVARDVDLNAAEDIDGSVTASPLPPLAAIGLDAIATATRSVQISAPVDAAGDLQARSEAALIDAGFFVRVTCRTTLHALGVVVRPFTIVNLRGAGRRHSGRYLCAGVRHVIDAAEHRMEIDLLRNGWEA